MASRLRETARRRAYRQWFPEKNNNNNRTKSWNGLHQLEAAAAAAAALE